MKKILLMFFINFILLADTYKLTTLYWPPYIFDENTGIAVEIIKETFSLMGDDLDIKLVPWSRAMSLAKTDDFIGVFPAYFTEEREKDFYYAKGFKGGDLIFFTNMKNKITIKKISDLIPYKIGVTRGFSNTDAIDNNTSLTLIPTNTEEQNFYKLLNRRIDLLIADEFIGDYILKNNDIITIVPLDFILEKRDLHLLIDKNFPKAQNLITNFNASLEKLIESGRYDKIYDKYLK